MELIRGKYDTTRNSYITEEEPTIFHCHHYNCFLQAVILDTAGYLSDIDKVLSQSAQEVAFTHFDKFFANHEGTVEDKKYLVEDYFRFAGFGVIDLSGVSGTGGKVHSSSDHYATGWKARFGTSKEPVSFFSTGFIAGATEAIFGLKLGTLTARQTECMAMGQEQNSYVIVPEKSKVSSMVESQGLGVFQPHTLVQPNDTGVDYHAVREALINMPIEGRPDDGLIHAFDVLLTRHYANYYCNISYSFLNMFHEKMGDSGISTATSLLIEAGHTCAFHTFGGVMQSNEWNGLIKPMLRNHHDWVHGMIAAINAFGWGFWEVDEFVPNEKLRVKIYNGYEANAYLKKYVKSDLPISFLATGGVAGLMNLIYTLDLPHKAPVTLDATLYKEIHMSENIFSAKQLQCRAMGDAYDLIEAVRR